MQNYLKTLIINASKQQQPRTLESKRFKTKKSNIHQHKEPTKCALFQTNKENGKSRPSFLNSSCFVGVFSFLSNSNFLSVSRSSQTLTQPLFPCSTYIEKKSGIQFGPLRYSKTKSNQKVPNPKRIPTKIIVKCMVLFRVFKNNYKFYVFKKLKIKKQRSRKHTLIGTALLKML